MKIFRTMLIVIATFVTRASCDESLKLELRVLGSDYCQFTSTAQAVTIKAKLKFTNLSTQEVVIHDTHTIYSIVVAKTLDSLEKGDYEVKIQSDVIDPPVQPTKKHITIPPGASFEQAENVSLVVDKALSTPSYNGLQQGTHYLKVLEGLSGENDKNPLHWVQTAIWTSPVPIKLEYRPRSSPCSKGESNVRR